MNAFDQTIDALIEIASVPQPVDMPTMQAYAGQVISAAQSVDDDTRSQAIGKLVDTILAAPPMRAAYVALTCGALVESGAHPYIAVHAIITRLGDILGEATLFAQACLDMALSQNDDTADPVSKYGEEVARSMGAKAAAYAAMDMLCRPAVAMISRSKRARRAANDEGRMASRIRRFPAHNMMIDWMRELLDVLDEETITIIHPRFWRGYRVTISGIAGNHQLMTLVEAAIIGDGFLPGTPPDERVLAAAIQQIPEAHPYQLNYHFSTWQGLTEDGALSDDLATWIWGEGIPAQIPSHPSAGRVILLGDPPYQRTYAVNAPFQGMIAELDLIHKLSDAEITYVINQLLESLADETP